MNTTRSGPSRPRAAAARIVVALCLLVSCGRAAAAAALQEPDPLKVWETYDFKTKPVRAEQIQELAPYELERVRGIVFGRHGRIFKDSNIDEYLRQQRWYKPDPSFTNAVLNDVERRSLDVIREAEARAHDTVEPGDLRWWRDREVDADHMRAYSSGEYQIVVAEIEAVRGKQFDEPWLQKYFEERYWYRADPAYDAKTLTPTERKNIETFEAARREARPHTAVSPGDMELFESRELTEGMLAGLGLYELRLLRNEVYARKGRMFRTSWLQQYFWTQPWYVPVENKYDVALAGVDKRNVETIARVEARLHEEIATKALDPKSIEGLFLEDARRLRNEIFARRGMTFKDRGLQRYFASFDWYAPSPKFSEKALTPIERQNVATLLEYEKTATSELDLVEG